VICRRHNDAPSQINAILGNAQMDLFSLYGVLKHVFRICTYSYFLDVSLVPVIIELPLSRIVTNNPVLRVSDSHAHKSLQYVRP